VASIKKAEATASRKEALKAKNEQKRIAKSIKR
jgi:hypothetical protein